MKNLWKSEDVIVIGGGYVATAYQEQGYQIVPKSDFVFNGKNFWELIPFLYSKQIIINALAKTDTRWTEERSNFKELWTTNVVFVQLLSEYCLATNKKLIHISTGDLYGNDHDWQNNTENKRELDLNTDYRLSKYASERVCNKDTLILRIRLPFDDRPHPKNLLMKLPKFTSFYNLTTGYTYLPDLIASSEKLVNAGETGTFNVECETTTSIFYICKDLLDLPNARGLSHMSPLVKNDFDAQVVNPMSNIDKLLKYHNPVDLEAQIITSYNKILTKPETTV
jgi:nucleoside-diphosphate-sugar epimerase